MGHKTLIDGVGYDITGGRCLVDGVGYSIQKGRTLVDGVGYDVAFGGSPVSITISGTGSGYANAIINGTTYTSSATGIEVLPGDVITFTASGDGPASMGTVKIDGNTVFSTSTRNGKYEWAVPDGITNIAITLSYNSRSGVGSVTVTTS